MVYNLKEAWVHINMLNAGEKSYHSTPRVIKMRISGGRLAENDDTNMNLFMSHFKKVLNNNQLTHDTVLNNIRQREVMVELDAPPKWNNFEKVATELINDKAPGLNGVPPNTFKEMSDQNLIHHFNFIIEFWEGKIDFEEWYEGQVVPVPKSGDLSDPNKWRGSSLMDIGANIFSSMICK